MNNTHKLDEMATPEMTAKAWDDYLQVGPGRTISARYGSPVHDATLSPVVRDATLSPCPGRWTVQPHITLMAQAA